MWLSSFWMAFNQIIPWLMEIKKILSVFNVYLLIFERLSKSFLGRLFEDYSKIINWLLKDYWKDYWKGGGVRWKNYPLFDTDILPPEGDPGLGLPFFLVGTIYTWTQFEKSTDLFVNHWNVYSVIICWSFADYRPIILIILIIVDYQW